MENILELLKTDNVLIALSVIVILLIIGLVIVNYIKNVDNDLNKCIQKIGIVRYNAFQDTGSDLSFALALLDEKNNGVVLNGIYSREMSNIYAKPVENGKSKYTISEEENLAIEKAINGDGTVRVK